MRDLELNHLTPEVLRKNVCVPQWKIAQNMTTRESPHSAQTLFKMPLPWILHSENTGMTSISLNLNLT